MENKYYNLIAESIKAHRKFSGLEEILDQLIEDVYDHAKVVLESVDNDATIAAYLDKVITTSLITVPKKLNINKRKTSKAVELLEHIQDSNKKVDDIVLTANFVGEIDTYECSTDEETGSIDDTLEQLSEPSTEIEDNSIEATETITAVVEMNEFAEEDDAEQNVITFENESEIISDETSYIEEDNTIEVSDIETTVDKSLIDKMINGVPDVALEQTVNESFEEFEPIDVEEETTEINETIDIPEASTENDFEDLEIIDTLDIEDTSFEGNSETNIETNDADLLPISDEVKEDFQHNLPTDETFTSQDEELELSEAQEEFEEDVALQATDNQFEYDNLNEIEALDTLDDLEDLDITEGLISSEEGLLEEPLINTSNFNIPSFEYFAYTPYKLNIDEAEIIEELKLLDSKHPQLRILDIFDLKFNKQLTINDIVSNLNIDKELVIDALVEIESIVED